MNSERSSEFPPHRARRPDGCCRGRWYRLNNHSRSGQYRANSSAARRRLRRRVSRAPEPAEAVPCWAYHPTSSWACWRWRSSAAASPWRCRCDIGIGPAHGAATLSTQLAIGFVAQQMWGWLADRVGGPRTVVLAERVQFPEGKQKVMRDTEASVARGTFALARTNCVTWRSNSSKRPRKSPPRHEPGSGTSVAATHLFKRSVRLPVQPQLP